MTYNRKQLFRALRWVSSIVVILILLRFLNWRSSIDALLNADWRFVLLSIGVSCLGVAVSCVKWRQLLQALDLRAGFVPLVRWYLIGAFANNFLPTDVGGDVVRGLYTARALGSREQVALSIISERLTGIAGMFCLAIIGAAITAPMLGWLPLAILAMSILALGLLAAAWRWRAGIWRLAPSAVTRRVAPLLSAWQSLKPALPKALVISLGFHVLVSLSSWLNLYAVGVRPPFLPFLALVPLISLLGMLPIAINGWGVREAAFVFLLAQIGLSPSPLFGAALLGRAVLLLISAIGAPLTLYEQRVARQVPRP